jgi:hypothetical protein
MPPVDKVWRAGSAARMWGMKTTSRRSPVAAVLLSIVALLSISYVGAYLLLGDVHYWDTYGGGTPLHVRSFHSRGMVTFFDPLARLESRLSQRTALAFKKQPRTGG